jgi:dTMP kinase
MPGEGKLIVLESADGALLGRQSERLYRWLRGRDQRTEQTQEPTNGPVGAQLQLAQQGRLQFDPRCLALLGVADRLDHLGRENGILDWLKDGVCVLCSRYLLSSYARLIDEVPFDWHTQINARCRAPDLTLYVDAEGGAGAARYRRTMERLAGRGGDIVRVDGTLAPNEVERQCRVAIACVLSVEED